MKDFCHSGKINIAYLIDTVSCDTAGTQKQLLETIRRLDRNVFSPHLVCLWQSEWMKVNTLPCSYTVLGYRGFVKRSFPTVIRKLRRLIEEEQFHIVQTFFVDSIFVAYFAGLTAHPAPVLLSSRRDIGLGVQNQPWYHKLFSAVLPIVNRSFTGIVSNSEEVKRYVAITEKVPLEKIRKIMNGVDVRAVPASVPDIFGHALDAIWIGLVASLTPVKRHDILLQAVAILEKKSLPKPVRVLLIGEGSEQEALERLCDNLKLGDIVHFLGAVRDVDSYLHYMDIGVICSDREGLSNAILEYMACGKPVIATSVGGNPELINGQNGLLVPPGNPEALAAALAELVLDDDKRRRMGAMSLQIAREQFSWQKSMSELESYYREIVRLA